MRGRGVFPRPLIPRSGATRDLMSSLSPSGFGMTRREELQKTPRRVNYIKAPQLKEDFVIFGLRACDMRALNLLDTFFKRNFEDNLYLERRKRSTLITLVCPMHWEECFCESVGSSPLLEEGFDIQIIPVKDRYIAQIGTEKGTELFKDFRKFFKPANNDDIRCLSELKKKLKSERPKFVLNKIYENLKQNKPNLSLWQDMAARCQNCGLCLFICPTCSCFTVNDRRKITGSDGRVRQWDACYFSGFTRMAANQDPVKSKEEMMKRKYVHKFLQQIDEFNMPGCTGCGRCNRVCVGNVNWLENLIKIEKE
jgi:ferredoxin